MIRVLIADDDTIVRTSLKTMVEWEREGITIVAEAANGRQALEYLQKTAVDVLLTDIKMPSMDGLELLEALAEMPRAPSPVVLSAYEDFLLVRRAFTLGAVDYLLKSEMRAEEVVRCVKKAAEKSPRAFMEAVTQTDLTPMERLRDAVITGRQLDEVLETPCVMACFELDNYMKVKARFGNELERDLVRPLLDFANQLPKVASRGIFLSLTPARYLLALYDDGADSESVYALLRQILRVWKTYMNLSASVGLSRPAIAPEALDEALGQCLQNVSMRFVLGPGQILSEKEYGTFDLREAVSSAELIAPVLEAVKSGNDAFINETRTALFAPLFGRGIASVRQRVLSVVYHTALSLLEMGTSLCAAFDGEEYDYAKRVAQFESVQECEIWTTNFLRHIADFLAKSINAPSSDAMEQARRFLLNHYTDLSLSVSAVAEAVGLSEKYFSTRFNAVFGTSVTAYVNGLRMAKAIELLNQSDLKVYEIAEIVGFRNQEHFIRVFRSRYGMPPTAYKKTKSNEISTNRT